MYGQALLHKSMLLTHIITYMGVLASQGRKIVAAYYISLKSNETIARKETRESLLSHTTVPLNEGKVIETGIKQWCLSSYQV